MHSCRKFSHVLGHCHSVDDVRMKNDERHKREKRTRHCKTQKYMAAHQTKPNQTKNPFSIIIRTSLTKSSNLMRPSSAAFSPSPRQMSKKTTAFPRSIASMTSGSGPANAAIVTYKYNSTSAFSLCLIGQWIVLVAMVGGRCRKADRIRNHEAFQLISKFECLRALTYITT